MRSFIAYFKISFKSNTVYRFQFLLGILGTYIQIFVYCAIWKALYANNNEVNGITYTMVTTNFVLALAMSNSFSIDDFAIAKRLRDGSIATEMLKPIDLRINLLASNLGEIFFKLLVNFLPAVLISKIFIGILPPAGIKSFLGFLLSMVFGFSILWSISTIVQMTSFWIVNVWSVSTIKNVFINVLSGAMLPLWFMPQTLRKVISFTPFETIYYTPINIYLGRLTEAEILVSYAKQLGWFVVLFILGNLMWDAGKKRVFVQGG